MRLGQEVGYQVRIENAVSGATKIRYATEGILLRRMLDDPQLKGVSALVFEVNKLSSNYDSREINATTRESSPFVNAAPHWWGLAARYPRW